MGNTIKLPGAPTREGYTFKFWKGSQYAAGADYKVEGDHVFTAEWEKNATSDTGDDSAAALTLCALMALASLASLAGSAALRRGGRRVQGQAFGALAESGQSDKTPCRFGSRIRQGAFLSEMA